MLQILENHTDDQGAPCIVVFAPNVGVFKVDVVDRVIYATPKAAHTLLGAIHFNTCQAAIALTRFERELTQLTSGGEEDSWLWELNVDYKPCPKCCC
jgi:hypothetical protein